ncbi:MAG: hypothetical protein R2739_01045 [Chitinophagales bacterium]
MKDGSGNTFLCVDWCIAKKDCSGQPDGVRWLCSVAADTPKLC